MSFYGRYSQNIYFLNERISNLDTEQSGNDTVSLIKRYQ